MTNARVTPGTTQTPEATQTNRVLLIDDHDLIRQGLARAFEGQDDFSVCGQAASVGGGVASVRLPRSPMW